MDSCIDIIKLVIWLALPAYTTWRIKKFGVYIGIVIMCGLGQFYEFLYNIEYPGDKIETPIVLAGDFTAGVVWCWIIKVISSLFHRKKRISNQKLDPTVKTPVESGNEQGTAGQL